MEKRHSKQYEIFTQWSTSKNPAPKLAGRKTVFENRRIRDVFEDHRRQFDAPDDEDLRFLEVLSGAKVKTSIFARPFLLTDGHHQSDGQKERVQASDDQS